MVKMPLVTWPEAYIRRMVDTANESAAVGITMAITLAIIPPASTTYITVSL
jgi:hypothetical protein